MDYVRRDLILKAYTDLLQREEKIFTTDVTDALMAVPLEDVVPVKHGEWIADKEDVEWGNSLIHYRCSECKERPHFDKEKYRFILSPYCPNCGANMKDGDGE